MQDVDQLLARFALDPGLADDVARWIRESDRAGREASFIAYRRPSETAGSAEDDPFSVIRRVGTTPEGRLFHGDNLQALAVLLEEGIKVQCVYIDPPYATDQRFARKARANEAYSDTDTGAAYLDAIRPRLVLLRELLKDDGVIFVHLDATIVAAVKVLLDHLFGKSKFRSWITRRKCSSKNFTRRSFGDISDYVLFYSKSDDYLWHRQYDARDPQQKAIDFPKSIRLRDDALPSCLSTRRGRGEERPVRLGATCRRRPVSTGNGHQRSSTSSMPKETSTGLETALRAERSGPTKARDRPQRTSGSTLGIPSIRTSRPPDTPRRRTSAFSNASLERQPIPATSFWIPTVGRAPRLRRRRVSVENGSASTEAP
jgi:hypothetical protein